MTNFDELKNLTIAQLKQYKSYVIGEIKLRQHLTRCIDRVIKEKLTQNDKT